MASIAGILLKVLGRSVTLQLCLGHSCGVGVLLVAGGVAVLHSEQAVTDVGEVLLHLVHVLGEVGGEDSKPSLQIRQHALVFVRHELVVSGYQM